MLYEMMRKHMADYTDEQNLRWCWLRAVEWGAWPIFISQPIALLALLIWPWENVIIVVGIANVWWALCVRYQVVVPVMAFLGALFVRLKWICCPLAAILLWERGQRLQAAIAFFWPLIAIVLSMLSMRKVGPIQKLFMQCLGYQPTALNPLR
jgi:hypothetical protein